MTVNAVTHEGDPTDNQEQSESDEESQKAPPGRQLVTLEKLGHTLPLGVLNGTERVRDMAMKPWRMKEERELGQLRDKHKKLGLSGYVAIVVGTMFEQLGGIDFTSMKKVEDKLVRVSQMAVGDVLYAYTLLRTQTIGEEFKMSLQCGQCSNSFSFLADLNSLDVTTCNDPAEEEWTYSLLHPFEARKKQVEQLTLREPVWEAMKALGGKNNDVGSAKSRILQSAIIGFADFKNMQMTQAELDLLTKTDLERILDEINDRSVGPELKIEEECPHCGAEIVTSIDWGYDSFFASSSQ